MMVASVRPGANFPKKSTNVSLKCTASLKGDVLSSGIRHVSVRVLHMGSGRVGPQKPSAAIRVIVHLGDPPDFSLLTPCL